MIVPPGPDNPLYEAVCIRFGNLFVCLREYYKRTKLMEHIRSVNIDSSEEEESTNEFGDSDNTDESGITHDTIQTTDTTVISTDSSDNNIDSVQMFVSNSESTDLDPLTIDDWNWSIFGHS